MGFFFFRFWVGIDIEVVHDGGIAYCTHVCIHAMVGGGARDEGMGWYGFLENNHSRLGGSSCDRGLVVKCAGAVAPPKCAPTAEQGI